MQRGISLKYFIANVNHKIQLSIAVKYFKLKLKNFEHFKSIVGGGGGGVHQRSAINFTFVLVLCLKKRKEMKL